jgi:hypothetical protein
VGGTRCQRPWGGKLGGQQGPRRLVGECQPTDAVAVGERDLFLGIDLPDLMGFGGAGDRWDPGAWPPGAIDASVNEGLLEGPDRRDKLISELFNQLNADQSGSPSGVVALHLASGLDPVLGGRRGDAATGGVVGIQGPGGIGTIESPDAPDGAVGEAEERGDLN